MRISSLILGCIFLLNLLGAEGAHAIQAANDAARVYLLHDGVEAGQARIDLIQKAKKSITAQYFIYADDETSYVSLALLREAAHRGVRVRILVDALFNGIPIELREYLQYEGVEIREYHQVKLSKLKWVTRRLHDKVLIIDDEEMITGGRNIQNDYYNLPGDNQYIDRDAYVKGEVVSQAVNHFEELWNSKEVGPVPFGSYTRAVMNARCEIKTSDDRRRCEMLKRFVTHRVKKRKKQLDSSLEYLYGQSAFCPTSGRDWAAEGKPTQNIRFISDPVGKDKRVFGTGPKLVELINSAQKYIIAESPYFVPDKDFFKALKAAVDRGVEVKVLTNSAYSGDNLPVLISYYKSEQKDILKAGIKLLESKGPASVHAKSFVIDGKIAFVGSFNWDRSSYNYNSEVGIITEDEAIALELENDILSRMSTAWIIGSNGRPTNLEPGLSYPWEKGSSAIKRGFMRLMLPLYKRLL